MAQDGVNISPTTTATTKSLKQIRQRLWAILGLKMALDRLRELGFYVVAVVDDKNIATITVQFNKLAVDLDSGSVNSRDILSTIGLIDSKIKAVEVVAVCKE